MCQQYQSGKLLLALTVVVSLSVLLGGCVAVKEKLAPAPGRMVPLGDAGIQPPPGSNTGLVLACGLQERFPKEDGLDPDAFWKESQILALQEHLERRGLKPLLEAMRLFGSKSVQVGFVPVVGAEAGIAWEERGGQRQAVALIKQENGTLNIHPDGREELWTLLGAQAVRDLVEQLRKQGEFQAFEKELAAQGRQLALAQSLGVTEAATRKGLLYLAVAEGLTVRSGVAYYRVELSGSSKGGYQLQGAPVDLCAEGENGKLGFPDGASMSLVGTYEARSKDELQVQVVRPPRDPCLFGLGGLVCLDTQRWLTRLIEEKSDQSNMTTLEYFNWALKQEGVDGSVLYAEDIERGTKLLLAGYEDLTLEQIRFFLQAAAHLDQGPRGGQLPDPCLIGDQQPIPSEWISIAREFLLSNPDWRPTLDAWDAASRKIGTFDALGPRGQDKFNLYVAAFILSVKLGLENPSHLWGMTAEEARVRANQILQYKLNHVLGRIKEASTREIAEAWADKIIVASRTLLGAQETGDRIPWVLLDFLRVVDSSGNEVPWTTSSPPSGASSQTIDVVVWRPFLGHPNGTLLAFLKVDSSRPHNNNLFRDPVTWDNTPSGKAQTMIDWLKAVYAHITGNTVSGAAFYWHGMKIVGWIFTNSQDPNMMKSLINEIQHRQKDLPGQQFLYPFFIAYVADGRPEVVCFGCNTKNEVLAVWLAACQLGGICAQNVQVIGGSASTKNMVFPTPGMDGDSVSGPGTLPIGHFFMADGGGGGGEDDLPHCGED